MILRYVRSTVSLAVFGALAMVFLITLVEAMTAPRLGEIKLPEPTAFVGTFPLN